MAFILVTIMLDMLAMSLVIPVLPRLVLGFMQNDTASASRIIGIFGTCWALMQFIFSPIMGALSDRFGRRPVVLISNIGLGLDYIMMALAPGIGLLFVGRLISGVTAASMSTAQAYIADVTPPEKRAANYGLMSVAFGLGFILGPAFGGLLGQINPRLPFWVAAGFSLTNALYGFFILPESLPKEQCRPFSWRKANALGAFKFLRSDAGLAPLAVIHFLFWLSRAAFPAIMVLYVTYRYGWNIATVGLTFGGVGLCSMIVGGGLVKPIVAKFGEKICLIAGLVFGALGMAVFGFASTALVFWVGVPIMSLMGLTAPALQGLMTRRIAPNAQGELQGAFGSVMALAQMVGPGLFSFVFAEGIATHQTLLGGRLAGAPFFVAALLLAVATGVGLFVTQPVRSAHAPKPVASG
ncbi:MAG TPA: TCR/Tet family MFS transporter [Acidocella sp.]|nr:TCR/Tet family MFS transporter [Acidocella sp.]HQU04054.1 TCR/Tet family MFS transporter [Acidocella sp.]